MRFYSLILLLVLGLLFCGFSSALGDSWPWTGSAGTNGWDDVLQIAPPPSENYINNWGKTGNPPPLPGSTDDVNLLDYDVVLDYNSDIQTLELNNALAIQGGKHLTIGGDIENDGLITLNSTSGASNTYLEFTTSATLGGAGQLRLNQAGTFAELKTSTGVILTQSNSHSVSGFGRISAALNNEGVINANSSGNILESTTAISNLGTMRASGGGILSLKATSTAYDNTAGTIEALNGSRVELNDGVTITGGTLSTTGTGVFRAISSSTSAILNNLASSGNVEVYNSKTLTLTGTINNTGTILVNSTGSETYLRLSGDVTVTGNGAISLSYNTGAYTNHVRGTGSNRLTNGSNHTIKGSGDVGYSTLEITNQGTIEADQALRALEINPYSELINSGTLRAVNGACLDLYDGSYNNNGGTISALDASQVRLFDSATITGGTLSTTGTGAIRSFSTYSTTNPATLANLTNAGIVEVPDYKGLRLTGTITNTGTIQVNSTGHTTNLRISGNTIFTGDGLLRLSYSMDNVLGTGSNRLTNQTLHNIKGSGALGGNNLALTNYGLIEADQAWSLDIDTLDLPPDGQPGFLNYGVVRSKGSGGMTISGTSFSNPGTVEASGGSTLYCLVAPVQLSGTTLTDGTWIARAGSTLSITKGSTIATNQGTVILDGTGSTFAKINSLNDNQDTFEVLGGRSFTTVGNLSNTGSINISGGGTFTINGSLTQVVGSTLTDGTWVVGANSTLIITTGSNITTNQATVILDGLNSSFSKFDSLADNQDTFELLNGRGFTTTGNLANSGSITISGGGTLTIAGDLTGTGSIIVTDTAMLYVNRIAQDSVHIGSGAKLVIYGSGGAPLAAGENLSAVPEPQTWLLILAAIFGLGVYRGHVALKRK